ncbi:MAG: 2-amino-4-hydroxy-6-hydroxymethyldihydropteridine diphosphokinase [Candidatus Thiothrix putei]|uniref:2-amino-4-hydroxy-6-hydroxymethyldihydropteridine diphosphokinase n=1 Tax=Candidatus Thiothrix putei TaxID=3080811 RepID=A0AA95HEF3_9GAMM|nr:MAG: 2-amino-4-hydroxy-6-hydroxymethyldihydropteridine diphosphokinase [Candidatus Thiothrix putei]
MANVYVSIGSNIERELNVCACMQRLQQDFGEVQFSTVYETPAVGFESEPFFNLAAGFTTTLTPNEVKHYLQALESTHGRVRNDAKFSARTLDVDLLLYDDLNLQPSVNLPHKDILTYPFVLFPLAEIAPGVLHPELKRTLADLAQTSSLSAEALRVVALDCLPLTLQTGLLTAE